MARICSRIRRQLYDPGQAWKYRGETALNRARLGYFSFLLGLDLMPIPFLPAIGTFTIGIAVLGKKAAVALLCCGLLFQGASQAISMITTSQATLSNMMQTMAALQACAKIGDNITRARCAISTVNQTGIGRLFFFLHLPMKPGSHRSLALPVIPLPILLGGLVSFYSFAVFIIFRRYSKIVKQIRTRIRPLSAWRLLHR